MFHGWLLIAISLLYIVVLFAMPSGSDKEYLGFLAKVMMVLRAGDFCDKLLACSTPEEVAIVLANQE